MTRSGHRRASAGGAERGVALLEAIVAVGVFAMLLAMLQGALWTSQAFLRATAPTSGPIEDSMVARRVLQQWFASAVAAVDPADARPLALAGGPGGMRFPIAITGTGGRASLALADLVLEPVAPRQEGSRHAGSRLVARRLPLEASAPAPAGSVLLEWPGPLAFAYSRAASGEPAGWALAWDGRSGPPRRVAVMSADGPVFVFSLERNLIEVCTGFDLRAGDWGGAQGDERACGREGER